MSTAGRMGTTEHNTPPRDETYEILLLTGVVWAFNVGMSLLMFQTAIRRLKRLLKQMP